MQFEKELNDDLAKRKLRKRHLRVHLALIPVARDQLIPYLVEGKGDMAAAMLTITPQRLKEADFSQPFATGIKELLVTGQDAPALKTMDDLSGQTVYVRESSSYYQSLLTFNQKLKKAGKAPVKIEKANENLETEDILEMVNAGLIPITVADDYLAKFWKQIFTSLKINENLYLSSDAKIGWAVRKNCPEFMAAVNRYVKKHKKGTLLGNILIKRYLQNTKWAKNVLDEKSLKNFRQTIQLFKRYAGQYSFDWLMVTALAYQESGLDQSKVSHVGAVGVMQLMPSTAAGNPINIPDIKKLDRNIHAGVKYLRFIYDQYFKDTPMDEVNKVLFTFASYNAGPARVAQLRAKAKAMGLDPNIWFRNVEVAAAQVIGRETVQYVSNIFKYYLAYKQLIAREAAKKEADKAVKQ